MENRLLNIETKLAFQEDSIDELNRILCKQQDQIDRLQETCKLLIDRIGELQNSKSSQEKPENERPPHY